MSSIWGWITYPFSWWSAGETELPVSQQFVGSAIPNPTDIVDIRSRNVTVWCNDQTCTTMKCDKFECTNTTCNIYDTDFRGECKIYNILSGPKEYTDPQAKNVTIQREITEAPSKTSNKIEILSIIPNQEQPDNDQTTDGDALELEAVLSSSVNKR